VIKDLKNKIKKMTSPPQQHIVIIGGGIIGSTTAYYLSTDPAFRLHPSTTATSTTATTTATTAKATTATHSITLLEGTAIASAASGRAGGLLATWAYPECIAPLSFRLHDELAEKFGGAERWGYRRVRCGTIEVGDGPGGGGGGGGGHDDVLPSDLAGWVGTGVSGYESRTGETAQLDPALFTRAMADEAVANGVDVVLGRATRIEYDESASSSSSPRRVTGVTYTHTSGTTTTTTTIPATTVILAAGPWSSTLLPDLPTTTCRAHSVVLRPTRPTTAHALFTAITLPSGHVTTPEIYPRPDGTVYACGEVDDDDGDRSLPPVDTAADVEVDDGEIDKILAALGLLVGGALEGAEVVRRQACYLPNVVGGNGGPLVGTVRSAEGLVVATGHTCWGIQNSAATGKCVSEIVWYGEARSPDITELDPRNWGL
jgi:glycine/D-amino acid oxidase-like deaminating enzyme